MPGRNASEAVTQFLAPLQQALSCLGQAKITVGRGQQNPPVESQCSWSINTGAGLQLRGNGRLFAAMWWKVIRDERKDYGPFRVTTLGYDYSLVLGATEEMWAMHWHPDGPSEERLPHVHLGDVILQQSAPVTSKSHLPTPRMTFETAVRWCISFGANQPMPTGRTASSWPRRHTCCTGPGTDVPPE